MIGLRHEKYESFADNCPFSLTVDLERTKFNPSKEQNWHKNPEIQLCTSGNGTVLLDGNKYAFSEGDIVVVNPDVIHYTYSEGHITYTCLIISTKWCDMMNIDCESVKFSPVIKDKKLVELLNQIVATHSNRDDSLRSAKLNKLLLQFFIELVEHYSGSVEVVAPRGKNFEVVKGTVDFLRKNYNRKITLDEISDAVFYNKYALCKEFKKYTGQTIIEYLNRYRTIKAIDYIKEGRSVSETAFLCGFENLSFFTRTFKRFTGRAPSFYKKEL